MHACSSLLQRCGRLLKLYIPIITILPVSQRLYYSWNSEISSGSEVFVQVCHLKQAVIELETSDVQALLVAGGPVQGAVGEAA